VFLSIFQEHSTVDTHRPNFFQKGSWSRLIRSRLSHGCYSRVHLSTNTLYSGY